eukprot:6204830-Pleurochrysis_carterae.AAC.1
MPTSLCFALFRRTESECRHVGKGHDADLLIRKDGVRLDELLRKVVVEPLEQKGAHACGGEGRQGNRRNACMSPHARGRKHAQERTRASVLSLSLMCDRGGEICRSDDGAQYRREFK